MRLFSETAAVLGFVLLGLSSPHVSAASSAVAKEHWLFRFPQPASFHAVSNVASSIKSDAKWLRASPDNGSTNWVEFGSRVVLQIQPSSQLPTLIAKRGLKPSRHPAPNVFILDADTAANAVRQASLLANQPGVIASYPIFRGNGNLLGPYYPYPSDKGFVNQWPIENRNANGSHAGPDLNVRAAWPYTLGQGVTVGVADTGIELLHQELSNNVAGAPHHNFVLGNTNGLPVNRGSLGAHGTEVAGLLAAGINNFRMVGVAPEAHLASMVLFDSNIVLAADEARMDAYQYDSNVVQVQNHSWGISGTFSGQLGPTLLEEIGMSDAIANGREGKGTVFVRAGGDGRAIQQDVNDNGFASDPRVIAVGSITSTGRVASYSDPGACLLVAAPSGDPTTGVTLFTTDLIGTDGANPINYSQPDLNDYVFNVYGFSGTSASAPQISGLVALMLSANPNLTWRDVQAILVLSSRHFDFSDPDVSTNGAGFIVSHNVGFGVPDAGIAVPLARLWTNLPPATNITVTSSDSQIIPPSGLNVVMVDPLGNPIYTAIALPSLGKHPDDPTPLLPLVDCGLATNPITLDLTNKGALIERWTNSFMQKITYAANAGAAFAVIYNYPLGTFTNGAPGGDQLFPLGGTDFAPIPAVFISYNDAQGFLANEETLPGTRAQIVLNSATYTFTVTNSLSCEHVALRLMTENQIRGNLRITLTSPLGTRSVLDRYNSDTNAGPADWTYYTTHCWFENSAGVWTAAITDEGENDFGQVDSVSLSITGPPQTGPVTREQILENYLLPNPSAPVQPNLSGWNNGLARLSWTAAPGALYQIWAGTNVGALSPATNLPAVFPTTEWFTSTNPPAGFFAVKRIQ